MVAWFLEYRISQLIGDVDGTPLNLEQERAKLARAQTARAGHALQRELAEVILISEVDTVWQEMAGAVRSHLLAIPAKLAPILAPITDIMGTRRALEAAIQESLDELVRVEVELVPDESG